MTALERELVEALEGVLSRFVCEECGAPATRYFTTEGDGPYWLCDTENGTHAMPEFYAAESETRPLDSARSLLARAKATTATGQREAIVTDDGHARAMVEGKRISIGGCGMCIGPSNASPLLIPLGTRVLVEFREGTDFATLVRVMP